MVYIRRFKYRSNIYIYIYIYIIYIYIYNIQIFDRVPGTGAGTGLAASECMASMFCSCAMFRCASLDWGSTVQTPLRKDTCQEIEYHCVCKQSSWMLASMSASPPAADKVSQLRATMATPSFKVSRETILCHKIVLEHMHVDQEHDKWSPAAARTRSF